jgi:fatty-acyl-CoA synthase
MADTLIGQLSAVDAGAHMLLFGEQIVTFGEVVERSARIAQALHQQSIQRGDRVAILLPNGPEWFFVAAACSRLGVAILSLNTRIGTKEAGDLIARTRSAAIIYDAAVRGGAIDEMLRGISPEKLESVRLVVASVGTPQAFADGGFSRQLTDLEATVVGVPAACDDGAPDDPFLILATSGTTSIPKLVVHNQRSVVRHAQDVVTAFNFDSVSKVLLAIPLCGAFGFTIAMTAIAGGRPLVLFDAFDAPAVAKAVRRHAVTHMLGTNDMLAKLLAAVDGNRPFPSLLMYGHANFTPGLTELPVEAQRRGAPMRGMYGMSETMAFLATQPLSAPLEQRAEGGGHLVCRDAHFRVRDIESGALMTAGGMGELEVASPNCMIGYFEDPERTAEAFTNDGYLRTGDLVVAREDNRFDFVSRKGDILRIGGYLVSPAEIEDVIKAAGPVAACQVVAIPHADRVRPVAFVVPEPTRTLSEDALMTACAESLATYKRPIRIFTLDALPSVNGPNGSKVKKNELRTMAMNFLEAEP